ncbi:holo-ACP synthase [Treponema sp.]|uniref:holo-ACP synthase n=1 Tax=Treponema sp. TaxID=166 RepID=UPI0025E5472F|nr:holo-ACP synthase [Treponema sp.]MBR4321115.1 holo-ACP synthase [Treponema sp.]
MIFGLGTDIAKVSRFEKWVKNPEMIARFFNPCEIVENSGSLEGGRRLAFLCEHYASRFAAKEAFAKALGTGFVGLELSDFGIVKNEQGKPSFFFGEKTLALVEKICGKGCKVSLSISHEKEFAVSFVVIECLD